jgi:hypothetical protein
MAIRKVIPRSLDSAAASANLSFDANTLFVDSTNNAVGINTATPNTFAAGGLAVYTASNPSVAIVSGGTSAYLRLYTTSDADMYLSSVAGTMTFTTAATARMTINSSGNVSIGTTSPTPLVGTGKYLTLSNNSHSTLSVQAVDGGNDRNATLELLSSGNGGSYSQIVYGDTDTTPGTPSALVFTGYHSGTSTERMRIMNTGLVGIGTSSPTTKLNIADTASSGFIATITYSGNNASAAKTDFVQFKPSIELNTAAGEASGYTLAIKQQGAYKNSIVAAGVTNNAGNYLAFSTTNEAMRIISDGKVGIGTTAPANVLTLNTGFVQVGNGIGGAGGVHFPTSTANADCRTWRTRTDMVAYGDWGIEQSTTQTGTTYENKLIISPVGKVTVGTTAQSKGNLNIFTAASTQCNLYLFKNTQMEAYFGFTAADANLYIGTGGTMAGSGVYMTNGGGSWNTVSDERLKENLVSITDAITKVCSLRAVTGNMIYDETKTSRAFLIAQDVQAVLPEAVSTSTREDIEYLGVAYSDTIPLLVAAIKEQQVLIAQLQADVAALQAK